MVVPAAITGFEPVAVGHVFTASPRIVEAGEIKAFGRDFDGQAQHLGEDATGGSIFGTLRPAAHSEVLDLRPSRSKPARAPILVRTITRNQEGRIVQDM